MEDAMVDFDWVMEGQASEHKPERKKELLRKLNRIKNQHPTSSSLAAMSGIGRDVTTEASQAQDDVSVKFKDPVNKAELKVRSSDEGGRGSDPDLDGMANTLAQACISHPGEQTKYYCNDCKVFVCIQCIAFGDHRIPCQISQEEDSKAILDQLITERRQAHHANEMQHVLREKRGELHDHFEKLTKEVGQTIRCLQNYALDSLDSKITALINVAKASTDRELAKLIQRVLAKSTAKGSAHYYQSENALVITLPLLCINEVDPPVAVLDLNANNPTTEDLEVNIVSKSPAALSSRHTASKNEWETEDKSQDGTESCIREDGSNNLQFETSKSTNLSSRLSANLRPDAMEERRTKVISPQTTLTEEEADHDPAVCDNYGLQPAVPRQQVFEAALTHVDDRAVVWVAPQEDMARMAEVTAQCLRCKEKESHVEVGYLYVTRLGRNCVRVRVLKDLGDGTFYAMDVDSGEATICGGGNLYKASRPLLHIPPLAVPVKLYGVKKAVDDIRKHVPNLSNDIVGPRLGCVTIVVLEDNVTTLPLPAHVYYEKDGAKCGGNLAFTLLRKGLVRVITNYDEWSVEFNDHGLEWMLGMRPKLHNLDLLPFPLPLASGMWLSVIVEGLVFRLKDGEEVQPTIHYKDANKVGCRVIPSNPLLDYGEDERLQREIGESLRITEAQVKEILKAFVIFNEKLQSSAKSALPIENFTKGQPVLAYYSYGEGSEGEWCRAYLTSELCPKKEYVWVFFVDYGHRAMAPRSAIRELEESLRREPVYILNVSFEMPQENCQLKTIRKEIKDREDETLILIKVNSTNPRVYPQITETFVGISKAVQDNEKKGTYRIANVC